MLALLQPCSLSPAPLPSWSCQELAKRAETRCYFWFVLCCSSELTTCRGLLGGAAPAVMAESRADGELRGWGWLLLAAFPTLRSLDAWLLCHLE